MTSLIREQRPEDAAAVAALNEAAFGQPAEARLVEILCAAGAAAVSLVAEVDGEVRGHILFSEVTIDSGPPAAAAAKATPAGGARPASAAPTAATPSDVVGLGPMAVAPGLQRGGIGSLLVEEGLRRCAKLGYGAAVVLGHPGYYPRFGFLPAHRFGLVCEFPAPPEAFMAMELVAGGLDGRAGTVRYHPAFASV